MSTPIVKICKKCSDPRPIDEFGFNRNTKDKRFPYCKKCKKEYSERHYQENKQKYIDRALARYQKLKEQKVDES